VLVPFAVRHGSSISKSQSQRRSVRDVELDWYNPNIGYIFPAPTHSIFTHL
jgi:hypothetical protein